MTTPKELRYTKSHEWVRIDGDVAYVGITDFAQDSLGDIVYIELPEIGRQVSIDEELTTIESVKAAEPIYAPVSGSVCEINEALNDTPEKMNEDPYGSFMFAVRYERSDEIEALLDSEVYSRFVEEKAE